MSRGKLARPVNALRVWREYNERQERLARHGGTYAPPGLRTKTCPRCGGRLFPRPDDADRLRCEGCTYEAMGF